MKRSAIAVITWLITTTFVAAVVSLFSGHVSVCRAGAPYPDSTLIAGLSLDWSTHRRGAQGSDNFQLTWADDDNLYGAWGDGGGFGGTNKKGRVGLGVARVSGRGHNWTGANRWGGHNPERPVQFGGEGKSWGMVSVNGSLYMLVIPDVIADKGHRNHYEYVEVWKSTDHAGTWSRPSWRFLQSENLTIPTFLNFGKDHTGVPSELGPYVHVYFIGPKSPMMEQQGPRAVGLVVHKPGRIYLARVYRDSIVRDKSDYEFYRGSDDTGNPLWAGISAKQPVFEDASGTGWCMSAHSNAGLRQHILCTEHGTSSTGQMGIFAASKPWGPWTTVAYYTAAEPFGTSRPPSSLPWRDNVFFLAFATKWLSKDGRSFTLNFTGAGRGADNDSFNTVCGTFIIRSDATE